MTRAADDREVTMLLQSFPPVLGGAQLQVCSLAPLLRARGWQVGVVTRRPAGLPAREEQEHLSLRRVSCPRSRIGASLAYTAGGLVEVGRRRPRVLHAHDLHSPSTTAVLAGRMRRVPVVAKVLSSGPDGDVARLLTKPLGARRLALLTREVSRFICPGAETAAELDAHGVPAAKIVRIPNGVDAGRFRPHDLDAARSRLRARLGLPPSAFVALYCGRLAGPKRIDVLLEAFRDGDAHLVLAGDGDQPDATTRSIRRAGIGDRVHRLGVVADTASLYRGADVFVSASGQDGLSNAALEAMASGVPVVASRAGGMRELLRDDAGVLVDDAGASQIARAVGDLARDADRRQRIAGRARDRVVRDYALTRTADRLSALYDEVLTEANA